MEPRPADRGPGRIIFLDGASSSGKSSLAKALQDALPEPFLHVSSDQLAASGILPARRDQDGPFAWWAEMRPRFFAGFHRCLPALANATQDLTFGGAGPYESCMRAATAKPFVGPDPTADPAVPCHGCRAMGGCERNQTTTTTPALAVRYRRRLQANGAQCRR